jgi:CheY-like chemotaxis protein
MLLAQLGYDVIIASDPESALAILEKETVNLAVLDYSFPGQMNGEDLARTIRASRPHLPLIMLSGYPDLPPSASESVDILILKGAGGPGELLNSIARLLPRGNGAIVRTSVHDQSRELLEKSEQLVKYSKELQGHEKAS